MEEESLYSELSRFRSPGDGRLGHCIVRYPNFGHMVMHFVVVSQYRTNGYGRGVHCIVFFKNSDACDHCIVMCPDLGRGSLYSCCQVFGHW